MNVLITGSRKPPPGARMLIRRLVTHCHEKGYQIIVGDADGSDAMVIEEADALNAAPEVHGARGRLRHRTQTGRNITHPGTYPQRDAAMAARLTPLRDVCVAIWNGVSPGTRLTAAMASRRLVAVRWYFNRPQEPKRKARRRTWARAQAIGRGDA